MYIRKVIEVAWVYSGRRKYFMYVLEQTEYSSHGFCFPDEVSGMSCELCPPEGAFRGHFWDSFPGPSFLRVALWNAEGYPAPLSAAPQTPSLCTLLASAVRSADVSTNWGSEWPSVLWDWLFPLYFRPQQINTDEMMKWNTHSWCNIKCIIRRAAVFSSPVMWQTLYIGYLKKFSRQP